MIESRRFQGQKPIARVSLHLSYISNPKKPDIFRFSLDKY